MKLTKKSSYALNIIGELLLDRNAWISSKDIAEKYSISEPFVFLVFRDLRIAKIVKPKKGPGGGYTLCMEPENITPEMVFNAVEEKLDQSSSLTGSDNNLCKNVIHDLESNIINFLKTPILEFNKVV